MTPIMQQQDRDLNSGGGNRKAKSSVLPNPNDFLVQGLDEVIPAYADFDGEMYAGLLPMDNGDRTGNTMFWLFEPTEQMVTDSIVIWLNGGPGCSSFNCGVLMENSPVTQPLHDAGYCCLNSKPNFGYNEHTWTRATTMLYVEHPIGTGFSHGNAFPENEEEASGDLDAFLQNFLQVFDRLQAYDLYITGESYAGMFVPSIARYIHRANKRAVADRNHAKKNDRIHVHLRGAALGNGWIDPKIQGPATIDYSYWHGLIDKPTRDALHVEWANCMNRFDSGDTTTPEPPPFHPFNVQDDCGIMWGILQAAGNPNAYDITTWDPNVDQVTFSSEAFYNKDEVKKALHAPEDITWHGCRPGGGRRLLTATSSSIPNHGQQQWQGSRRLYMDNDRPFSVVSYIAELVDEDIPVIVYNGDRDMTTNMVGSELALNAMDWSGKDKWLDAKRGLWMVDDYPAGWAKEHGKLSFVVVYNSGHMVPYNQPRPAFDLLLRLLRQDKFVDKESPMIRIDPLDGVSVADTDGFHVATTDSNIRREAMLVIISLALGALLAFTLMRVRNRPRSKRRYYEELRDSGEISISSAQ